MSLLLLLRDLTRVHLPAFARGIVRTTTVAARDDSREATGTVRSTRTTGTSRTTTTTEL